MAKNLWDLEENTDTTKIRHQNATKLEIKPECKMFDKPSDKKKVLIYERREESLIVLQELYLYLGYEIEAVNNINAIPDKKFDLLITEIEKITEITKKVTYYNPFIRILIISNFSRDTFIEEIFNNFGIEELTNRSYKIRDLIRMSKIAITNNIEELFGLERFMAFKKYEHINRTIDFKLKRSKIETVNIGETVFDEVDEFIRGNNLMGSIEDVDMLHYAIGELVDNSLEAQLKSGNEDIELYFEYGFDENKFGFSIHDKLGTLAHKNVTSGIGLKMRDQTDNKKTELYHNNTYLGPRGRGYYIIQYSVHRLSVSVLTPETAAKLGTHPRTEASLLVYLDKHKNSVENQIGPCGISMVIVV
jgi:hypothetical protein